MIDKKQLSEYFSALGRKSVKARMKTLSPEERRKIARKAANVRWAKVKNGKTSNRSGRKS